MKAPFRSILCPTDLSPVGNLAVPVAYLLAAKGGTVHLLHVDAPARGNPLYPEDRPKDEPTPAAREAAKVEVRRRMVALVPADSTARGVATEIDFAEGEDIALAIEGEARKRKIDAVVLASHGRWGVSRIVHGESVATRLLHEPDLDVIVVHSDKP
jgi:nucleotide-binding universal stress UspA family protein